MSDWLEIALGIFAFYFTFLILWKRFMDGGSYEATKVVREKRDN
jgi:hypothetical protein